MKFHFKPEAGRDDSAEVVGRTGQLVEVVARRIFGARKYSVVRFADGYEEIAFDVELTA